MGNSDVQRQAGPFIVSATYVWIIFDGEDRKGQEKVSASFHQSDQRFAEIWLGKENKGHDGVTEYLDPMLKCHERKVGPENSNKAVQKKCHEPAVVMENFC